MPIGTVLDDGLANLIASFEIHRTGRQSTASGAPTSSTRDDGGAHFEPFSGSWSDNDISADSSGSLLGLLIGQSLSVGLSLSLSLSLGLRLLLLLYLHTVDDGSILTPDKLICNKLLLEPLLGLSRRLLDLLLDELRSLQRKPSSLLLRLNVGGGHNDFLQLNWLLDACCNVRLLRLL